MGYLLEYAVFEPADAPFGFSVEVPALRDIDDSRRGEIRALRWLVSGRVQGVGFRWFVLGAARRYGVEGDVKNLRDGRVEVRARGKALDLQRLLAEIRTGPASSRVDDVAESVLDDGSSFDGFMVRH